MSMNKKGLRQLSAVILIPLLILSVFSFSVPVHAIEGEQHFTSEQMITVSFRVEGSAGSIYPKGDVQVPAGSTVFNVMQVALDAAEIDYVYSGSGQHAYVLQIGEDLQSQFEVWDGWQYIVNGVKPALGIGQYTVQNNDDIYFYYGNIGDLYEGWPGADDLDILTFLPTIEIMTASPSAGQELKVKVSAKYDQYDFMFNLVQANLETLIEGAQVVYNGQSYVTDSTGVATIPALDVVQGTYELKVSKEVGGSYPRIVRSEKEIVIGTLMQQETQYELEYQQ